jgi:hypothetical protein
MTGWDFVGLTCMVVFFLFAFGWARPWVVWLGKKLDTDGPPLTEEEVRRQNAEYHARYDENDDPRPWWAEELRRRYDDDDWEGKLTEEDVIAARVEGRSS